MSEWSRRAPLLSVDGPGRLATAPSHGRIAPRYRSSAWSSRQSGGGCGAAGAVHRRGALASQEEAVVRLVPRLFRPVSNAYGSTGASRVEQEDCRTAFQMSFVQMCAQSYQTCLGAN
jgi:hypothetical protein